MDKLLKIGKMVRIFKVGRTRSETYIGVEGAPPMPLFCQVPAQMVAETSYIKLKKWTNG